MKWINRPELGFLAMWLILLFIADCALNYLVDCWNERRKA